MHSFSQKHKSAKSLRATCSVMSKPAFKSQSQYAFTGDINNRVDDLSLPIINEKKQRNVRNNIRSNIQPKLRTGQPNDKYEQEADRVSEQILRMPEPNYPVSVGDVTQTSRYNRGKSIARGECSRCESENVIDQVENVDRKVIQLKKTCSSDGSLNSGSGSQVSRFGETGQVLPSSVRNYFEPRFNHDFSDVRIHTNERAQQAAQQINARAYTLGNDIVFNHNEYSPHTTEGKRLIGHELTHTIQQNYFTQPLIQRDTLTVYTRQAFDQLLPTGSGFYFEFITGVTWGYPVYTGGHIRGEIFRPDDSTIRLIIYKRGRVGLDAGVGAGLYVGSQRRGSSNNGNSFGLGADAGANAESGVQVQVIEQYDLPIDIFFSAFLATIVDISLDLLSINPYTAPVASVADHLLSQYSELYLVRSNIEFGIYAGGDIEAALGIRRPTQNVQDSPGGGGIPPHTRGGSTWGPGGERRAPSESPRVSDLDPLSLLNYLSLVYNASVNTELQIGLDQLSQNGRRVVKLYIEGQLQTVMRLPIPFVSEILQMLPSGVGIGIELLFIYDNDAIDEIKLNAYQFGGEDEFFRGTANRQTFTVNLTNILSVDQIMRSIQSGQLPTSSVISMPDLSNLLETASFWNRFSLGSPIGRRFRSFLRRRDGARSLLSDRITRRSTSIGLRFEPYLTIQNDILGPDFIRILRQIPTVAGASVAGSEGLIGGAQKIAKFFLDFEDPALVGIVDDILDSVVVSQAELRILAGAGIAAGGRVAEGAKIRLDVSAEGGVYCARNLLEDGPANLRQVLEKLWEIINDPLSYLPQCPFLGRLYESETGSVIRNRDGRGEGGIEERVPAEEQQETRETSVIEGSVDRQAGDEGLETEGARVIRQQPDNQFPEEGLSRIRISQYQLRSNSLNADVQPSVDETDVYSAALYFVLNSQWYSVDVLFRVLRNNRISRTLTLQFVRDIWMPDIVFGFERNSTMEIQYGSLTSD